MESNKSSTDGAAELVNEQEAASNLFAKEEDVNNCRKMVTVGAGMLAVAAAGLHAAGWDGSFMSHAIDTISTPQPDVIPAIVDGFVKVNEGLRSASPFVVGGAAAALGTFWFKGRRDEHADGLNETASIDLAGTENVFAQAETPTFKSKIKNRLNRIGAGLGIAALTILLTGVSSGVEHEVSNGPLRPVERVFDTLSTPGTGANRNILVQSSNTTFMDDSYLSSDKLANLRKTASQQGISLQPFSKTLPNIDGRSGLLIAVPDDTFEQTVHRQTDQSCTDIPILLDKANRADVGDHIDINGVAVSVAGKLKDTAQMNRDVAIISATADKNCIQKSEQAPDFGAIASGGTPEELNQIIANSDLAGKAVAISQSRFENHNRHFWRANGTPILLQMMAYLGMFGAFATAGERRTALQRNVHEIGILNAKGVPMDDFKRVEQRRALVDTAKAAAIGVPLMPVFAAVFNAAEVGLRVSVGYHEIMVGCTIALIAKVAGGTRAVGRFAKKLSLSNAVKG